MTTKHNVASIEMDTISLYEDNKTNHLSSCNQSISICVSTDHPSSGTLSFRNIRYTLDNRRVSLKRCYSSCSKVKQQPQVILNGISGIFTPGLNAIMGKN